MGLPEPSIDDLQLRTNLEALDRRLAAIDGGSVGAAVEAVHEVGGTGEPAFQNTWSNTGYGGWSVAGFYKTASGRVYLRGLIYKNGGTGNWVTYETIFTLPSGYRPSDGEIFVSTCDSGQWEVRVLPSGVVQVGAYGGAANPVVFASLANISFRAA